jgi:integrase
MRLADLLRDHYAPLKGISSRTTRLYEMTLSSWSRTLGREPELTDLNEMEVAKFIGVRKAARAAATAAKDRAQVRALWEFAARRKMVETFPMLPRVKIPQRVPEAWLSHEVSAILAACDTEPGQSEGVPHSQLFRALVMLLYETGERISAAMALEWRDVSGNRVLFRAETRKGGERDVLRSLSPAGLMALDAIREVGPGGHFFGTPHTMARYQSAFYSPLLSNWDNHPNWLERGSIDARSRANAIWKQLLRDYEQPAIDAGVLGEIDRFIARRKAEGGAPMN